MQEQIVMRNGADRASGIGYLVQMLRISKLPQKFSENSHVLNKVCYSSFHRFAKRQLLVQS